MPSGEAARLMKALPVVILFRAVVDDKLRN